MKILDCPRLGPRPENEFVYGGVVRKQADPEQCNDPQWANYVFNRPGAPGIHEEWWYHSPTGMWFIARRDTVKDEFIQIDLATPERLGEVGHG